MNIQEQQQYWLNSKEQFPVKLFHMLGIADSPMSSGFPLGAICWLPHGRAFKVIDESKFIRFIAPMYFKQTKIRSFYRQLHMWEFKRLSLGADAGAWYNEHFLRGSPSEMKKMTRTKIKNRTKGSATSHSGEPDFYSMPPLQRAVSLQPSTMRRVSIIRSSPMNPNVPTEYNSVSPACIAQQPSVTIPLGLDHSLPVQFAKPKQQTDTGVGISTPILQVRRPIEDSDIRGDIPSTVHAADDAFNIFHQSLRRIITDAPRHQNFNRQPSAVSLDPDEVKVSYSVSETEPLPFLDDVPFDDMAQCIDNVLRVL